MERKTDMDWSCKCSDIYQCESCWIMDEISAARDKCSDDPDDAAERLNIMEDQITRWQARDGADQ